MSRKNKNFRAFMFLNADRFPTTAETWNAAWEGAQKHYHTKRMQEFERQLAALRKALESVAYYGLDDCELAARDMRARAEAALKEQDKAGST